MSRTPVPWFSAVRSVYGGDDTLVATTWGGTQEQAEANGRLIAAAPDLLEALKDMVALVDRRRSRGFDQGMTIGELTQQLVDRGDSAIAKAEGRS